MTNLEEKATLYPSFGQTTAVPDATTPQKMEYVHHDDAADAITLTELTLYHGGDRYVAEVTNTESSKGEPNWKALVVHGKIIETKPQNGKIVSIVEPVTSEDVKKSLSAQARFYKKNLDEIIFRTPEHLSYGTNLHL